MFTLNKKVVVSALMGVSAASFAMEPDQRALELALALANAAPAAPAAEKTKAKGQNQAAATLRTQSKAVGAPVIASQPQGEK